MQPLTALIVVALAAALAYADYLFLDMAVLTWLAQSLMEITRWLAFWR